MPGRKPLRIFAIPLAQLKSSSTPLIYYHVSQRTPQPPSSELSSSSSSSSSPSSNSPPPPPPSSTTPGSTSSISSTVFTKPAILAGLDYAQPSSWPDFLTHRASQFWLSFSQTQQTGPIYKTWKYKTWRNGERLMDKIEYEEWGLKNVDVGRDPWTGLKVVKKPEQTTSSEGEVEGGEDGGMNGNGNGNGNGKEVVEVVKKEKLHLVYPPLLSTSSPLSNLRTHLTARIPYHRRLLIRSSYLIPILLPIGLLPVVPNLPMFYVLWRMWSHWKAKRGAEYLLKLVEDGEVVEKESEEFGKILEGRVKRNAGDEKAPDGTSSEGFEEGVASQVVSGNDGNVVDGSNGSVMKDEAPDSTGTPNGMVYHSTGDSTSDIAKSTQKTSSASNDNATSTTTTSTTTITPKSPSDRLIFSPSFIPIFGETFELSPPEIVDLARAVEQAVHRVEKEEKEMDNEKEKKK